MARLIMTKGLPASGKSFWANQQAGFKVVTKDDIRADLEKTGWTWNRAAEKDVILKQESIISSYLSMDENVIAADTNFGRHEKRLKKLAETYGAGFEVKDFTDVPLETCLARNATRTGKDRVPAPVIIQMYKDNIDPTYGTQRVQDPNPKPVPVQFNDKLPRAVICDLDGTLCLHNGRSPFDYEKCDTDLPNGPILEILYAMKDKGYEIIFMSGREAKAREKTLTWLHEWYDQTGDFQLHMRSTGDFRKDNVVKLEMFNSYVRGSYNIVFVLDDRDQVVKMWRELGLTCMQVAYGNF